MGRAVSLCVHCRAAQCGHGSPWLRTPDAKEGNACCGTWCAGLEAVVSFGKVGEPLCR